MSNFVSNDNALEVLDKYAKGIKKGIGVVAVRETSPAAAAHNVGDYIRYNGQTYKVKSAISIGDSLILDTNIEAHGLSEGTTIFTPDPVVEPGAEITWRNIKVNGTEKLSTDTDSGAVDFINGTYVNAAFNSTGNTIKFDVTPAQSIAQGGTDLVTSGLVYSYIDTMITQALSGSY